MRYDDITPFDRFPAAKQVECTCKICRNEFIEESDEWQSDVCPAREEELSGNEYWFLEDFENGRFGDGTREIAGILKGKIMCKLFLDFMHGRINDFVAQNHELRKHEPMVRKFEGLVIKPFELNGELREGESLNINLVATCHEHLDADALIEDMRSKGFEIGEPEKVISSFGRVLHIRKVQIEDFRFDLQYEIFN